MYKVSPTPSIDQQGVYVHIDKVFADRKLPHTSADVLRLKAMRIGRKPISLQKVADELGVSRQTVDKWYKAINAFEQAKHEKQVKTAQAGREEFNNEK